MEQTLFICRSVDVFMPIPPRTGRGFVSGEWLVENKIATTRLRVIAIENQLEVRLEDLGSGEIFGACPVPRGQCTSAVESAVDSSRNFVLRIVDPATNRHAFLGINFAERSNAFDFNVALTDFEKRAVREEELKRVAAAAGAGGGIGAVLTTTSDPSSSSPSKTPNMSPEAAVLYQKHDFTLKEGEHFKVEVKKSAASSAPGGFLSRLGGVAVSGGDNKSNNGGSIGKLAPPLMPPPSSTQAAQQPSTLDPFNAAAFQQTGAIGAPATAGTATSGAAAPGEAATVVASSEEGWATF
ncbi:hypothetical protein Ndes2526B_g09229 [Nannochloris sp. 'desiccata']